MGNRGVLVFLVGVLTLFCLSSPAAFAVDCESFYEDFSGLSAHTWDFSDDSFSIQDGKLVLSNASDFAVADTAFAAGEPFVIDVDVDDIVCSGDPTECYFAMYTWTSGDVFFNVDGSSADGVAVFVWPVYYGDSGDASVSVWDVGNEIWVDSEYLPVPDPLTSIGFSVSDTELILRLNKQNTTAKFAGDFTGAASLFDILWIMGAGGGLSMNFDNVCAEPVGGSSPSGDGYDGIWKDAGPTMNFYVQTYAPGSVIVIATPNLTDFYVFLDSDVSDGVDVSDLAGAGHHLTLNFSSETAASATMTLAGSSPKTYAITKEFGGATDPLYDGIWKSPSCESPTRNYYYQTYGAGSAIAIVTDDLQNFMVFLDSDAASGFSASELSGKPFNLMLGFGGSVPGNATAMARCVAAPEGTTSADVSGYASLTETVSGECDVDATTAQQMSESVEFLFDLVTGVPVDSVLDMVQAVVQGLVGGEDAPTCPTVTVDPPFSLAWLSSPPSNISISADFGSGCDFEGETYSGSLDMEITGLSIQSAPTLEITGGFSATFNNLKAGSTSTELDGTLAGNLQMEAQSLSGGSVSALINLTSSNLSFGSHTVTGAASLSATLESISGEGDFSGLLTPSTLTFDGQAVSGSLGFSGSMEELSENERSIDLDLNFNNFGVPGMMINGTGTLEGTLGSTSSTMDMTVTATVTGPIGTKQLNAYITMVQSASNVVLNTTAGHTSTLGNATMIMDDVTISTTQECDYPESGVISFQCSGSSPTTVTYQGCSTAPVIQ